MLERNTAILTIILRWDTAPLPPVYLLHLLKDGIALVQSATGELGKQLSADGWDGLKHLAGKTECQAWTEYVGAVFQSKGYIVGPWERE